MLLGLILFIELKKSCMKIFSSAHLKQNWFLLIYFTLHLKMNVYEIN